MDTQNIWLVALAVVAPISGVVGFALRRREVQKVRLENEKLQLEIQALRAAQVWQQDSASQATSARASAGTKEGLLIVVLAVLIVLALSFGIAGIYRTVIEAVGAR